MCVQVVTKMCGSGWTPTPNLQDAHMFHPLSVIGKRVERSLRLRKVRSLFPLGPLSELIDRPDGPNLNLRPLGSVTREGPIRCDLLHEEFLDGVGRVRIQVVDYWTESGVQPMAPHAQLTLKETLPWLDSVHRLYLVSQTLCSSSCRVRLLGGDPGSHQLKLGPETPLGFTCLRLSALPSGLVEVKRGWESGYLHPKARWARYSSPEYERLTGGTTTEPRVMGMLSQLGELFDKQGCCKVADTEYFNKHSTY